MESTKLREIEKKHIHTEEQPEINSTNAHKYCLKHETLSFSSSFFKDKIDVYHFEGDFIYIPAPLKSSVKEEIVSLVLTKLLYPPYRNSIDRALNITEIDIYNAFRTDSIVKVRMKDNPEVGIKLKQDPYAPPPKVPLEEGCYLIRGIDLIKKIRWSSIGIYYDWEKKAYDKTIIAEIPPVINDISKEISSKICKIPNYIPETAVINYYQKKDRIMAHIDRYEEDMSKPLISYSFGCSCVFVLGKKSKTDPRVSTFLLQDGDIAILLNDSREYLHGVPKILKENTGTEEYSSQEYFPLISESRINISIRQAFKYE
ncbi:alkylated DNA repair protein alkB-like protein 1 [Nematocida sp. AWRm80]|nr:alkylated DNA repair protein alkB-like protein 1 [Nematocida sp. AWRm80]